MDISSLRDSPYLKKLQSYWRGFQESFTFQIFLILLGILLGVILSTTFAGWVANFQMLGFDPIEEPDIEPSVEKVPVSYERGNPIRGFENLDWQYGFEIYHINVKNNGPRVAREIKLNVDFPGCMIGYRTQKLSGKITTNQKEDVYIVQGNASQSINHCDQSIRIEYLNPDESASLTVVIKKFGTGFPSNTTDILIFDQKVSKEYVYSFSWNFKGYRENKSGTAEIQGADSSVVDSLVLFADHHYERNHTGLAVEYLGRAYQIEPNSTEVLGKYGLALSRYGYEHQNKSISKIGNRRIVDGLNKNSSDGVLWYYRAVSETHLMLLSDDERNIAKHYCKAIVSLDRSSNTTNSLDSAINLRKLLKQNNPGVECEVEYQRLARGTAQRAERA